MSLIPGFIKKPLGCIFSLIIGFFLLVIVCGVVGVIVADHFAVGIAGKILQERSGFTMSVAKQDISILSGAVDLQGLKIENPDRFAAKDFVSLNEVKAKVEVMPLLKKQIVVDEIVVDLDCLSVVENKDGEYNFVALQKSLMPPKTGTEATAANKAAGPSIPPFTIKKLTIRVHTAKYFDFASGDGKPRVYNLNYDKTFTDVTDQNLFAVEKQVGEDLAAQGFNVFLDVLTSKMLNYVGDAAGAVMNGAGSVVKGIGNALKNL